MPPTKRKRNDRGSVDAGESRPSPHRPGNTNLAQHDRGPDMRDTGRRSSQGGQGGRGGRGRRPNENPNQLTTPGKATPTLGPMSPPPPRPSSATQTPTSTQELPSPLPKREPLPFDYVFLTDDRIASWTAGGRQEVVEAGARAREDEDSMDLACIFQEIIRAVLDSRIDASEGGSCVKEILGPDTAADDDSSAFDAPTFFLDTFSMMCDAEDGPFNPILRSFAFATRVSPIIMRQKLDALLLQNLGLTRDTFIRVGIRQATHLLYRQANYNLLREETEGYSKLVTELFTTSGASSSNEGLSDEVVEDSFERVKGLIGTFDLDVGRVLDITLDVFAAVLIKHFRFFIKLLRVSSWWPRSGLTHDDANSGRLPRWALPSSVQSTLDIPDEEALKAQRFERDKTFWERAREKGLDAFFELGGRQTVDAESRDPIVNVTSHGDVELDADRQWIQETGTFPPSGNRVAAQLLGFKLRFYASEARDKEDVLPANLIYLTALLIKVGFISLRDIYPHLWPLDEDMPAVREARMAELAEKERLNRPGGSGTNALMMASALPDDTAPNNGKPREGITTKLDASTKPAEETIDEDKVGEPADQKVQLLTCLLTIGAIPEALFILGRFPWITEAYPEVVDLINRILLHSIQDVYDACRPTTTQEPECLNKQVADADQNGVPKGQVRLCRIGNRNKLRWPFPDKYDTNENVAYRFYWDEWADNIPLCQNVDDIFTLCGTLLNCSGVNIGKDAGLLSKLARIGIKSLSENPSPQNLDRWQDLLKRLLVPALSLTNSNTSVVNEIYEILRFYPIQTRYSIYAEWFEGQTSRLPAMKAAFARAKLETTGIMKRISTTNLTEMARKLAKVAYASPGIVFNVALSQIEAYSNLTGVVVECAKYFTDLGYDVLIWSLMSSLGARNRNRNNAEFALLPSQWLLALASFAGKICRRYSIVNISPVIQYVNHQLYSGNSTDLVILRELIAQMAGVVPDTDFTDAQLTAMTGGEVLRRQTLINLQDKRYESIKTAKRLMRALTETKLAGPLLLAITQHRQSAIYSIPDEEAHIKLLATVIDDTQLILYQYLDLLRSNLSVEDFDKHVPGIAELMTDFGLDPSLAFMISRASITYRLSKVPLLTTNGTTKSAQNATTTQPLKTDGDGDVGMGSTEAAADGFADGGKDENANDDIEMVESQGSTASQLEPSLESSSKLVDPYYSIIEDLVTTVTNILPQKSWTALRPDFYVMFWTSTLSDIAVPTSSYEAEITRLNNSQAALMRDRSDMSRPAMNKRDEMKKEMIELRESLMAEMTQKVNSISAVRARLLKRKSSWFEKSVKADIASDAFMEKCLIPRLLLSPSDADYCFKMIRFLHDNNTPYFRLLSLYGRIFKISRLRSIIFTCTVREAENLGRFLRLALADLARWHADAAVYEKEAWGKAKNLPGFAKALDNDGSPKGFLEHDGESSFKNVLFYWHKNFNSVLRECLDGTEWMHIRNAITVLKCVTEVFPAIDFMGNNFIKQLELITTREKGVREDLFLTGNAVAVQLKKRSKKWVMVQAFGYNMARTATVNGSTPRSTSQTSIANSKTTLKATAPEFKPQSRASSLGVPATKPTEVEDGEVDDSKLATAIPGDSATKASSTSVDTPESNSTAPTTPSAPESKKSDILLKREQVKQQQREREAASKAAAQSHSNIPARPESSRTSAPNQLPHTLPSRPDAPFPSRQQSDRQRHGDRDRRDVRDRDGRDAWLSDRPGERPRDYPPSERRGGDSSTRDFSRSSDRNAGPERERARLDPPRWTPDSSRENLERTAQSNRMNENSGRLSRDNAMPPPRTPAASSDRAAPVNSERLPQVNPERQDLINPDRAALISGSKTPDIRSDSPRRSRDDIRDRPSPRPQSPRRHATDREFPDPRHDDRGGRNGHTDGYGKSRSQNDDPAPPSGPRGPWSSDRANDRNERAAFQPTPLQQRTIDPDHGRLNPSTPHQSDPNFGRLNDPPSGPRDRNSIRSRGPPRRDGRTNDLPRPPTPEKQPPAGPPTGPSGRHPRRGGSGQFDPINTNAGSSTPSSAAPSPATSIHPDRLRHLGAQAAQSSPTPAQSASQSPVASVHPERIRSFEQETPITPGSAQGNPARSRPNMPSVATGAPPSGPKAAQPSPITPGANGLSAPTGPASSSERNARGRRDRGGNQMAAINTLLQQGNQQNSFGGGHRGRGMARAMNQPETPTSTQSTTALPPPPPHPPHARSDNRDLARDNVNPERADLITGTVGGNEERDRERVSRRDRPGRHSRRGSRSPDRSRDPKRGPPEDDRSSRSEHRDRRSDRGEGDRHQVRSPHRDLMQGREGAGNPRDSGRDRDRDRESGRRDGRDREGGGRDGHDLGGWSGDRPSASRNRDSLRGDERRDGRGRDDGGRKRRSDEGVMDSRGQDKRPRRA